MQLTVKQLSVGGYDKNFSYLVINPEAQACVIVDPSGEVGEIMGAIAAQSLPVEAIWLTHTHFDHYDGLEEVIQSFPNVPIYVHALGRKKIASVTENKVHSFQDEDVLEVRGAPAVALHTPGHIDDEVCFYIKANTSQTGAPLLITGDTLFVEGCGRCSEADVETHYQSQLRLQQLPDDTIIYPGHNYGPTPTSTIAHEKNHNRFWLAPDFEAFRKLRIG